METLVKIRDLFRLSRLIADYGDVKHGKTMWMLARNETIIKPIIEDVKRKTKPTKAMEAYEKARAALAEQYADRDDEGNPKQEINPSTERLQYVISRLGAYEAARKAILEGEHKQAKLDQEELTRLGDELVEEEVEVKLYRIDRNKIPGFRDDDDDDNGIIMAKDMPLLIELGIVYEPEDEDQEEDKPELKSVDGGKDDADSSEKSAKKPAKKAKGI